MITIEKNHTYKEWKRRFKGDESLWDFLIEDVKNGAVELDENQVYWEIGDRIYETNLSTVDYTYKYAVTISGPWVPSVGTYIQVFNTYEEAVDYIREKFEENIQRASRVASKTVTHDSDDNITGYEMAVVQAGGVQFDCRASLTKHGIKKEGK